MLLNTNLYNEDLDKALSIFTNFEILKNKTFFITGANGLICSSFVHLLIKVNMQCKLNLKIYLGVRDIESSSYKFFVNNKLPDFVKLIKYNANEKFNFKNKVDFVIHGASPASPDLFITEPVETMTSNIFGLREILEYAKINNSNIIYISSSEVYGKLDNLGPIKENESGIINHLEPRASYSEAKRAAETLCISYAKEYNLNIKIVRPGHIYGPTASVKDNRVSARFMFQAFNGNNIILKSTGEQIRSYTHSVDCASAILFVLMYGKSSETYNISNPNTITTIVEMAKSFAKYGNVEVKFEIPVEKEKKSFNPMNNSSLDSSKLESLGWKPILNNDEGYSHSLITLNQLKEYASALWGTYVLKQNELTLNDRRNLSLEIADEIHRFCEEHSIRYFLHAGTLLGAVRNGGYIPWDDDFDICMPRPDYEKFRKIFKSKKYRISYYGKSFRLALPFIKVYSTDTYGKTSKGRTFPFGLGVDVFPIDGYPDDEKKRNKYFACQDFIFHYFYLNSKSCEYPNIITSKKIYLIIKYILRYTLFVFVKSPLISIILNQRAKKNKFEKSKNAGCSVGLYRRKLECVDRTFFESSILMNFENRKYYVPKHYDEILRSLYGNNYMLPPPPESQHSIHLEHYFWKIK